MLVGNGRGECCEIGARRFYAGTKIGKDVFSFDGPMTASSNLKFHATATGPAGQLARNAGALMGGCKCVNKVLGVVEAGHGDTTSPIHHYRTARDTNAGTCCEQVISLDRLGNREIVGAQQG
jgi:hypothetical protein